MLPAKILIATNNEAPELMPKTYGPAIGFLKIICRINPAVAREEPASMAVTVFGNRSSQKIKLLKSRLFKLICSLPPKNKLRKVARISKQDSSKSIILEF